MKKVIIFSLVLMLAFAFFVSCKKKVEQAPPPPPQVKEQPRLEKVEKPPVVKKPQLSEEELFMRKSLEEINAEKPLDLIFFDFDKYFIREEAKPVLEKNVNWLMKFKTAQILIEGHCDERGTEQYNLALGEKRAQATKDYMVSLGVSGNRVKIVSYGKSQPMDPGHNEAAWDKNRRAHFVIIGK